MFCNAHLSAEPCDCTKDISERIDDAITTMKVADHTIRLLQRDKQELIEALRTLIENPRSTNKARQLLKKFQ